MENSGTDSDDSASANQPRNPDTEGNLNPSAVPPERVFPGAESDTGDDSNGSRKADHGMGMGEPSKPNPYSFTLLGNDSLADANIRPSSAEGKRLWTVFAVLATSLLSFMVASFLMTLVAVLVVHGVPKPDEARDPEFMAKVTESRIGFVLMVVAPQIALIIPCLFAASLSPLPFRQRLGLIRGNWPWWAWVCAMFATPVVGFLSGIVGSMFMEESEHLKEIGGMFRGHGTTGFLIPLALLIGATPAICEELLFRGYVQTRLTKSLGARGGSFGADQGQSGLGAAVGIVLASAFFAAFHLDWVHIITVFPIGVFLGWVRYRSGSLFPAMMGHFLNNVLGVILLVAAPENAQTAVEAPAVMVLSWILPGGILGVVGTFIAAIRYRPMSNSHSLSNSHSPTAIEVFAEQTRSEQPNANLGEEPPSSAMVELQE